MHLVCALVGMLVLSIKQPFYIARFECMIILGQLCYHPSYLISSLITQLIILQVELDLLDGFG